MLQTFTMKSLTGTILLDNLEITCTIYQKPSSHQCSSARRAPRAIGNHSMPAMRMVREEPDCALYLVGGAFVKHFISKKAPTEILIKGHFSEQVRLC